MTAQTPPDRMVRALRPHASTIFSEVSLAAAEHDAINLGQGFPDTDGPASMLDAAAAAIADGHNQYPPGAGTPQLREAIAEQLRRDWGMSYDPDGEILVTVGATEAIAASLLGLVEPGAEVVVIEPYYDSYAAIVDLAGARRRTVPLLPPADPGDGFSLDLDALAAACGPETAAIVVNTPHNPTGTVLTDTELEAIAHQCRTHDIVAISDEVYEHLTFDGARHRSIATLHGMRERTVRISGAAKMLSCTGWKIGWLSGPRELVAAALAAKQYLTYGAGTPLQLGVAHALRHEAEWVAGLRLDMQARRDQLRAALEELGLGVSRCQGTYFLVGDPRPLGFGDAAALCRELPAALGVAAVPFTPFVDDAARYSHLLRFAFCKRPEVLAAATERLAGLPTLRPGV